MEGEVMNALDFERDIEPLLVCCSIVMYTSIGLVSNSHFFFPFLVLYLQLRLLEFQQSHINSFSLRHS